MENKLLLDCQESISADSPFVQKHPRYISDFTDAILELDISEKIDGSRIHKIELGRLKVSTHDGYNPLKGVFALSYFPNFDISLRFAINRYLFSVPKVFGNNLKKQLSSFINTILRFFTWLAQRTIYRLADVSRKDIEDFIGIITNGYGWISALNIEAAFERLEATNLVATCINPRNVRSIAFNQQALQDLLGYPIHFQWIPVSVYERASKQFNDKPFRCTYSRVKLSRRGVRGVCDPINLLSKLPDFVDKLAFLPFSRNVLQGDIKGIGGKHSNISLEVATELLRASLTWVYEYSETIITLYESLYYEASSLERTGHSENKIRNIWQEKCEAILRPINEAKILPVQIKNLRNTCKSGKYWNVRDVVWSLQTACAIIIGINHGRRKNEIIGEGDLPFGVYAGCLSEKVPELGIYEIDFYVEKTYRDWRKFPANQLIADCIRVLERLEAVGYRSKSQTTDAKSRKLFKFRFPVLYKDDYQTLSYEWKINSAPFLKTLNLRDLKFQSKYHPFRRLFAMLYLYRYENSDIRALSQHFGHLDISMTMTYVTDPGNRAEAERLEKLYKIESDDLKNTIADVKEEYFQSTVMRVIQAEMMPSGFSKLIHKLYVSMQKNLKFPKDIKEQTIELTKRLSQKGYEPDVYQHGTCFAGNGSIRKFKSKCFDNHNRRQAKERASATFCQGCPYLLVKEGHLSYYSEEVNRLNGFIQNNYLSTEVKVEAENEMKQLVKIINSESILRDEGSKYIKLLDAAMGGPNYA